MFLRNRRNFRRIACLSGVIAAHQALQFREFIDHLRGQIRLGDFGRLACLICVRPHNWRQFRRQLRNPFDPRGLRAKFRLKGHILKALRPLGDIRFCHAQIIFPKEFRI